MQRRVSVFSLMSLLVGSLYVSTAACATAENPSAPIDAPAAAPAEPVPAESDALALPALLEPHIALLLPLNSPVFAKAADAVKQGFLAAASKSSNGLTVHIYPCADESTEVAAVYQQALESGAVAVAGPLTRDGVAALAASDELMKPTLALNLLDIERSDQLYFFGLSSEAEARQSAQRATDAGVLSATVVTTNTPLSKRLGQAFTYEWERSGGIIMSEIVYSGDPTPLKELEQRPGNSVFLAAELDKARRIRPYIDSVLPVYSTSQIFSGNNNNTLVNYDLADVRFVDMPWMLQPDHPAVMVYPHVTPPMTPDLERLYALGIDAYRLIQVLFENQTATALPLDGVTGRITLSGHVFQREATLAIMRMGLGVPLEYKSRP